MTRIIAEIGLAHDGSLGQAMKYIELASNLGCDAVKFQHHTEGESTEYHGFCDEMPEDIDRNAYWKRTGFTVGEWRLLIEAAGKSSIEIGISTFTIEGFREIADLDWDFLKMPSGEWHNAEMSAAMITTGKEVYISTGMADISFAHATDIPRNVVLMTCNSAYPSALPAISVARGFGLSDHSGSPWPAMYAVALGCPAVEVHLCMSKRQFGPDTESSVDPDQMRQIVSFRDAIHEMDHGSHECQDVFRKECYAEYKKCKSRFQR